MREVNPHISVEEIKQIIYETAYDLGDSGEDNSYGWGMVDAYEAVLNINKNPYTPSKPVGPNEWAQYMTTTFQTTTTDPEEESIYYWFDWGDDNNSGWVGPYASGQTAEASYAWSKIGEYEIRAKAKDKDYGESDWSEPHIITIIENEPPGGPIITGPKTGKPMSLLTFTVSAEDPEGNDVSYMVSWGDGHYVPYTELKPSGTEVTFSHAWSNGGDYTIIVKAMDQYGAKSPQSSFKLSITKNRAVTNPVLFQLLENLMDHFPLLEQFPNAFPILRYILRL
jgi:hypothetical protein